MLFRSLRFQEFFGFPPKRILSRKLRKSYKFGQLAKLRFCSLDFHSVSSASRLYINIKTFSFISLRSFLYFSCTLRCKKFIEYEFEFFLHERRVKIPIKPASNRKEQFKENYLFLTLFFSSFESRQPVLTRLYPLPKLLAGLSLSPSLFTALDVRAVNT